MREAHLSLSKDLSTGLRRGEGERVGLLTCDGWEVADGMLRVQREFSELVDPYTLQAPNVEFPQLFQGSNKNIVAFSDTLYEYDSDYDMFTEYSILDFIDGVSALSITSGNSWHFADGGDFWMLTNGEVTVFPYRSAVDGVSMTVYGQDSVAVQSVCYQGGRIVMGGFSPSDTYGPDWNAFWGGYITTLESDLGFELEDSVALGQNFVWWSSIGAEDALWMFKKSLAMYGAVGAPYHTETRSRLLEMLRRNEWGFMPVTTPGQVLRVLPLGDGVVVYSDTGVCVMPSVAEPFNTYGLKHLYSGGIASRDAAGGGVNGHVFVSNDYTLWGITGDMQLQKIGYRKILQDYAGSDFSVLYNEVDNNFYITAYYGGAFQNCFLLSTEGLTEVGVAVTGIGYIGGERVGFWEGTKSTTATFTTVPHDLGLRANKLVRAVSVDADDVSDVSMRILYRNTQSGDFTSTPWRRANPKGFCTVSVDAVDFEVQVSCVPGDEGCIRDLVVYYQLSDYTGIRGLYSPTQG